MKFHFTPINEINWSQLWMVVGMVAVFWGGLAALTVIYPQFDSFYKCVNIVLSAVFSALIFAARANKYARDRIEPPADGKP